MNHRIAKRLEAMISAFDAHNIFDLKRIGNDAISDAVLENSKPMAQVSVISYSLYKMLSKRHFVESPRWKKVSDGIVHSLQNALESVLRGQEWRLTASLEDAISKIDEIDLELSNYARGIHEKAKVKQASTAYAMGMSLNQAAELTSADRNDLQRYIGVTRIHDEQPITHGIAERLNSFKEVLSK